MFSFGVVRRKFRQNLTLPHTRTQNRRTVLKSSQNRENNAISSKSVQNARLGAGRARFSKISFCRKLDLKFVLLASNHRQIGKTVLFQRKVHRTHVCGRTEQVLAKCHLAHTRSQNRRTGLKSSSNQEHSGISSKSAQVARLGPCGASFGKISFYRTLDLKVVVLASNHRQIVKTVRFLQKVYNTHV